MENTDDSVSEGIHLSDNHVVAFLFFQAGKSLPAFTVHEILARVFEILRPLPNLIRIPMAEHITVVGDIHGQLDDLLTIFKLNGMPSQSNQYLFNGDFVGMCGLSSVFLMIPHVIRLILLLLCPGGTRNRAPICLGRQPSLSC